MDCGDFGEWDARVCVVCSYLFYFLTSIFFREIPCVGPEFLSFPQIFLNFVW